MGRAAFGLIAAAVAAWAVVPLVWALAGPGHFTGADGPYPFDQMQYLAWVRDAGESGLASNRFDTAEGGHVFLHPMFTLSGLGWRLFGGVELWLVIWKPVAVAVLFGGFAAYVRRHVDGALWQAAALFVAVFYAAPAVPLADWLGREPAALGSLGGELCAACSLWGYLPGAIAVGLMPVYLLALERESGRALAVAAAAGALAAWLHPWQGQVLLVVTAGLLLWPEERRRWRRLALPAAATLAPLAYYFLLARLDPGWENASGQTGIPAPSFFALAAALLPLLVLALPAARREVDRALLLWAPAALLTYLALSPVAGSTHPLKGMSLPLAVLAVRAAAGLRLPAAAVVAVVAVFTVPGLVLTATTTHDLMREPVEPAALDADELAALRYIEHSPRPGPVLTTAELGAVVPAFTGRRTWVGHPTWTPRFDERRAQVEALLANEPGARRVLADSRAAFVLVGCADRVDLGDVATERRFGCAGVHELRRP